MTAGSHRNQKLCCGIFILALRTETENQIAHCLSRRYNEVSGRRYKNVRSLCKKCGNVFIWRKCVVWTF